MNKKQFFNISGLALVAVFASLIFAGCTKNSTDTSSSATTSTDGSTEAVFNEDDVTPGQPYLSMTIANYPKTINDRCQKVSFTINVKNEGDTALTYKDFSDMYAIKIVSDDAISTLSNAPAGAFDASNYNDDYGLLNYQTMLNDFGEIGAGKTGTITFNSINYEVLDQHEYSWVNGFNNITNGTYSYYVTFSKISDSDSVYALDTVISKSSSVEIATNNFDADGGGKYCATDNVNDKSIDFYNL